MKSQRRSLKRNKHPHSIFCCRLVWGLNADKNATYSLKLSPSSILRSLCQRDIANCINQTAFSVLFNHPQSYISDQAFSLKHITQFFLAKSLNSTKHDMNTDNKSHDRQNRVNWMKWIVLWSDAGGLTWERGLTANSGTVMNSSAETKPPPLRSS